MLSFLVLDGIMIYCIPNTFFFPNHTHTYNKTKQARRKASPD